MKAVSFTLCFTAKWKKINVFVVIAMMLPGTTVVLCLSTHWGPLLLCWQSNSTPGQWITVVLSHFCSSSPTPISVQHSVCDRLVFKVSNSWLQSLKRREKYNGHNIFHTYVADNYQQVLFFSPQHGEAILGDIGTVNAYLRSKPHWLQWISEPWRGRNILFRLLICNAGLKKTTERK